VAVRSTGDRLIGSLGSNSADGMDVVLLGLLCVVYVMTSATS
jgi:hypothetical protein